jgi:hypothetical protein
MGRFVAGVVGLSDAALRDRYARALAQSLEQAPGR